MAQFVHTHRKKSCQSGNDNLQDSEGRNKCLKRALFRLRLTGTSEDECPQRKKKKTS